MFEEPIIVSRREGENPQGGCARFYHTVDLYAELAPPAATSLLRLPNHIVPPPLSVEGVTKWLRPSVAEDK